MTIVLEPPTPISEIPQQLALHAAPSTYLLHLAAQIFQDKSQTSCLFTPTYFRRHVYRDVDIYFIPGYPFHTWWNFHKLLSTIVWSMETSPIATFFSVDLSEPEWKPNPISLWYSVCRSRQSRTLPSLCSFKCSIFRLILSCSQTCSLSLYFLQTGL